MASRKKRLAKSIHRRAVRIEQNAEHPLYQFALRPDELEQIAEVSRISRDKAGKLIGYQRGTVKQHIKNIDNTIL